MGSIPASPDARNVPLLLCLERFNEASLSVCMYIIYVSIYLYLYLYFVFFDFILVVIFKSIKSGCLGSLFSPFNIFSLLY